MNIKMHIPLNSAEISMLWLIYQGETLNACVFKHFLRHVEDVEVKECLQSEFEFNQEKICKVLDVYEKENHVIPAGFGDQDVNLDAPRLYTDVFYLYYLKNYCRFALKGSGVALGLTTRRDIIELLTDILQKTAIHNNKITETMLSKGVYLKPPIISVPSKINFVESNNFFYDLIGKHRVLLSLEATHLYGNIQSNLAGRSLFLGLSQVAEREEIQNFLVRLTKMADKHVNLFSEFLRRDMVSTPMPWDNFVTTSTISPFSDKLIMFFATFINTIGLGDYGDALAASARSDLVACYQRLITETLKISEDAANLMIKYHWMEEPPKVDDRESLIHSNE